VSLVEQMWQHVQATEVERLSTRPPRILPLELGDLREAINHLAALVEDLRDRVTELERQQDLLERRDSS
jgi:hypothetical protein